MFGPTALNTAATMSFFYFSVCVHFFSIYAFKYILDFSIYSFKLPKGKTILLENKTFIKRSSLNTNGYYRNTE